MKLMIFCIAAFLQFGAHASDKPALTVNEELSEVYNQLYAIDYRKLTIEDFSVYTESLNKIRDLSKANLCGPANSSTTKIIVFEETLTYTTTWTNCGSLDITDVTLKKIESNGVRSCYKDGFTECTVKEKARLVSSTNNSPNTQSATCTILYDTVILGKK